MSASVAEHMPTAQVRYRVIHIGILVVPGTPRLSNWSGPAGLQQPQLERVAASLARNIKHVYHNFDFSDRGVMFHYSFAVDVRVSHEPKPVVSTDVVSYVRNPSATYRDARTALLEAHGQGLENVVIIVPELPGPAHALKIPLAEEPMLPRSSRQLPGLMERTSNSFLLGMADDINFDRLTDAHEVGHLLGLTNVSDYRGQNPTHDIMGIGGRERILTEESWRLIHLAVDHRLHGYSYPQGWATSGTDRPFSPPGIAR